MTVTASTTSRLCISVRGLASAPTQKNAQIHALTASGSLEVTDDVGHTSLVTKEGGEVDGLLGVILHREVEFSACYSTGDRATLTLGNDLAFPLWRAARFLGRNPRDPCLQRGVSAWSRSAGRSDLPRVFELSVRHTVSGSEYHGQYSTPP
jgi:hypothetical protein